MALRIPAVHCLLSVMLCYIALAGNCAAELSDKSQLGTPDDATKSSNMANASCSDDAVVHTSLGEIHGRLVMSPRFSPEGTEVQVEQYLGIPYAVPPVGELRFTNPEPFGQFPGGVLDACDATAPCMQQQGIGLPDVGPRSEDCLHLNVWRPLPIKQDRAVMVWIHGGAFDVGSVSLPSYNATLLSALGDVIIVAMNYRLNVMGFFHTGDERMQNSNFGLLDQQLALRWVQQHISAFGGDPSRVTVFGASAGGASVAHLLLMPGSQGLFNRAIMQSGDSAADWASDPLDSLGPGTQSLADIVGCPNDADLVPCLCGVPGTQLVDAYFNSSISVPTTAKVDGVTIPDNPETLLHNGHFVKVDSMIGYTQNEGSMFIYYIPGVTPQILYSEPWTAFIRACYVLASVKDQTQEEAQAIRDAYRPPDNSSAAVRSAIANLYTDNRFLCPGEFSAQRLNEHGVKVYEYLLTMQSSFSAQLYPDWYGVVHGDELQWVFGWPFLLQQEANHTWTAQELIFSVQVMDRWTRFAKYGSPDSGGEWTPYTSGGPAYLELRGPAQFVMHPQSSARPGKCALWRF